MTQDANELIIKLRKLEQKMKRLEAKYKKTRIKEQKTQLMCVMIDIAVEHALLSKSFNHDEDGRIICD